VHDNRPVSYVMGSHNLDQRRFQYTTSEKGRWAQVIPQNQSLESELFTPCGESIQSDVLQTTVASQTDYSLTLNKEVNTVELAATVIGCDGMTSETASYQMTHSSEASTVYAFGDDSANHAIVLCDTSFALAGLDLIDNMKGPDTEWTTSDIDKLSLLTSCTSHEDGYSYMQIRSDQKVYPSFSYITENGITTLSSDDEKFRIAFRGDVSGSYTVDQVNISIDDISFGAG